MEADDTRSVLMTALQDALTDREYEVIVLRFGLRDQGPMTLEAVGKDFHVTRERIRQIEVKAIAKIKKHPMIRHLSEAVFGREAQAPAIPRRTIVAANRPGLASGETDPRKLPAKGPSKSQRGRRVEDQPVEEWQSYVGLVGQDVTVHGKSGDLQGEVTDVLDSGSVVIRLPSGEERTIERGARIEPIGEPALEALAGSLLEALAESLPDALGGAIPRDTVTLPPSSETARS